MCNTISRSAHTVTKIIRVNGNKMGVNYNGCSNQYIRPNYPHYLYILDFQLRLTSAFLYLWFWPEMGWQSCSNVCFLAGSSNLQDFVGNVSVSRSYIAQYAFQFGEAAAFASARRPHVNYRGGSLSSARMSNRFLSVFQWW